MDNRRNSRIDGLLVIAQYGSCKMLDRQVNRQE